MYHSRLCSLALLFIGLASNASQAQEIDQFLPKASDRCIGDLEKRHLSNPPWDFTTNSRRPTPQEPTSYLHCIFNNDPKNVVEVDWLIPMVKQPIRANSSAISPRYSNSPPLGRPDGCLIFGNLRDKALRAQFWARLEDEKSLKEEDGKNCLALRSASLTPTRSKTEKRADSIAPFRVFLRSNPENRDSSLLAFEGITGLRMKGANAYQNFITYRLRDEKGEPPSSIAEFTIAPRSTGPAELIAKWYLSVFKEPIKLLSRKEPTTVAFFVEESGDWDLQELEYLVRDRSGKISASFFSPVYVPLQPR